MLFNLLVIKKELSRLTQPLIRVDQGGQWNTKIPEINLPIYQNYTKTHVKYQN